MAESTLAERRLLALQRDWRSDVADLLRDGGKLLGSKDLRSIERGEPVLRELEDAGGFAAAVWSEMREHVPITAPDRRRLDRLCFVDLDQSDAVAVCLVEEDDSALVRVSDGLLSLLGFLAGLHTYLLFGRRMLFQTVRLAASVISMEKGRPLQRAKITDLLLRDYLIDNKLSGERGMSHPDLSPRAEALTNAVALAAYWFVLAHEAGHFLLGHPTSGLTSVEAEKVPVIAERPTLEYDADMFALEHVQRMIAAGTNDQEPYGTALVGAGVALLAIYLFERGTLLRPARTHPPAEDRWTVLTERAEREERYESWGPSIDYLYTAVRSATSAPGAYSTTDWAELPAAGGRRWARPIRERLETLPAFDHLLNGPLDSLGLDDLATEFEGIARADAAQRSAHTINDALLRMGVDATTAARVADPETALSFHRLLTVIQGSEALGSVTNPELSLIAGAVLTRRLGSLVEPRSLPKPAQ